MSRDASVDSAGLRFICVEDVVVVAEEAAQHRGGGPVEAAGFDAGEEPSSELLGVQRGGGAVEVCVGLAVGGEEKSGFIAGDDQVIEGGELSRLMMISLHGASG